MGTDIRAFIEYRHRESGNAWFGHAEVMLERDYRVFGAIAGVGETFAPMIAPRGFPGNASAAAIQAYFVHVIGDEEVSESLFLFVRASEAANIVTGRGHYRDDTRDFVSHPDATLPSWLTAAELRASLARAGIATESLGMNWQLAIETLQRIEEAFGGEARLVFWFE